MNEARPLWIRESEVVQMMDLGGAIEALEAGLRQEADGWAKNMSKTHLTWGGGSTLHAIGAAYESSGVVATKSWAHTKGGAMPLLLMWDADTGALLAVIEAFALGQMRTGAISGVATRWMSREGADIFALLGTGKQALAQLAAVAAVRPLKAVRVWGRDQERRRKLIAAAEELGYDLALEAPATVMEATDGASIVTLVTRAREPFFTGAMAMRGAHVNAVGAITPEREEFAQDVLAHADLVAADDPTATRQLSREFRRFFDSDAAWERVRPISSVVSAGIGRPEGCDLSLFKAMGMGVSDLALGIELYRRAVAAGLGKLLEVPSRVAPRLGVRPAGD